MKEVEQPLPHEINFSICVTNGFKKCFLRIPCRDKETRKTAMMLVQAYGSMKWPNPRTTKMKYFYATVTHSKSMGLFGLASMFRSISATKTEKKEESLSKKLSAGSDDNTAKSKQIK